MALVAPFCTRLADRRNVYHNDDTCVVGNNIESFNLIPYVGIGRRLCDYCDQLEEKREAQRAALARFIDPAKQLGSLGLLRRTLLPRKS